MTENLFSIFQNKRLEKNEEPSDTEQILIVPERAKKNNKHKVF